MPCFTCHTLPGIIGRYRLALCPFVLLRKVCIAVFVPLGRSARVALYLVVCGLLAGLALRWVVWRQQMAQLSALPARP